MEQAEQFFSTADSIGREIKPILLYYGLNQAVRALAAACVPTREAWTFDKHGLSCRNTDQIKNLSDVTVNEWGRGGFQMLNRILEAPGFEGLLKFGDLWASLSDASQALLNGSADRWSALYVSGLNVPSRNIQTADASPNNESWSVHAGMLPKSLDGMRCSEALPLLYQKYPLLRPLRLSADGLGPNDRIYSLPTFTGGNGRTSITLKPRDAMMAQYMLRGMMDHGSAVGFDAEPRLSDEVAVWVIPCLPGNEKPLDPLTTWWAVLYCLSIVARYSPSKWTAMLDINKSPDAASIEHVLDCAHKRCIKLISRQISWRTSMIDLDRATRRPVRKG